MSKYFYELCNPRLSTRNAVETAIDLSKKHGSWSKILFNYYQEIKGNAKIKNL